MLQLIHLLHLLDASDVYNDVLDASPRGILSRSWHLGKVLATKKVTIKKSELGPRPCKKRLNAAIFWVQSPKCSLEGCFVNLQRGTTNGLRLGPASHPPGQKTPSVMERRLFYYFKQSQPFVENFEKCQEKSRCNFFEGNGVQKGRKVRGWGVSMNKKI